MNSLLLNTLKKITAQSISTIKPDWEYLVHYTTPENKKKILKEGFKFKKGPFIYTLPDYHLDPDLVMEHNEMTGRTGRIEIIINADSKVLDLKDNEKPRMQYGFGSPQYNKIYHEVLKDMKYLPDDKYAGKNPYKYYEQNKPIIDEVLEKKEKELYEKIAKKLLKNDVDVIINGGEILIVNLKIIKEVRDSSAKKSEDALKVTDLFLDNEINEIKFDLSRIKNAASYADKIKMLQDIKETIDDLIEFAKNK